MGGNRVVIINKWIEMRSAMKRKSIRTPWIIVPLFLWLLVSGAAYSATLLKGDLNGDNTVNVFDALLTLQYRCHPLP
jgi:hypothetical protein